MSDARWRSALVSSDSSRLAEAVSSSWASRSSPGRADGLAACWAMRVALATSVLLSREISSSSCSSVVRAGPYVQPGHQGDVVDGQHVGRLADRDQQRVVVDVLDRHRAVAAGGRDVDRVERALFEIDRAKVDVGQL